MEKLIKEYQRKIEILDKDIARCTEEIRAIRKIYIQMIADLESL